MNYTHSVRRLLLLSLAAFPLLCWPPIRRRSPAGSGKAVVLPKPLVYLSKTSIDFVALLPPPPAGDSLEAGSEMETIRAWQTRRTSDQCDRCKDEEHLDPFRAFASVLGSNFTEEKLPLTAKLLAAAAGDSKFFSASAKNHWTRRRPPFIDPTLKPAALLEDEPSYPSGHATRGTMYAELLAKMVPEKADALLARGQEIGFDRVIAAVHYPSDVVAGRVLGHAVAGALLAAPTFNEALAAATAELRGAVQVAAR